MWEQGRSFLNLSSWQPWWLSVSPFTLFGRRGEATTSASWSPSCLVLFSCLWSLLLYRYDSCFYKVMTIHKMVHFVVFYHLVIGFSNMKRVRWAAWNDDCHCYFNHNIFVSCRHLGLIGLFFVLSRGAMTSVLTRCNLKFFANILHSVSSMYHICATLHASLFYTSHCHWWHRCFANWMQLLFPLGRISVMVYGCLASVIFCGYIIYDTDNLIKRYSYDEYIWASVSLYLDIINLFLSLLTIFRAVESWWIFCLLLSFLSFWPRKHRMYNGPYCLSKTIHSDYVNQLIGLMLMYMFLLLLHFCFLSD